ncbi:MAG TPA: FAD-binding oxidoreductase [Lichenihabitans sp.]|jgi:FAD/FMN-containing dehydrogenase|nr:FAD-binding oxidoreductase [Lichenihabitans sp.]
MTSEPVATTSWGRVLRTASRVAEPAFLDEAPAALASGQATLPRGLGRSYGDVCLNDGGTLVRTRRLDRIIAADWQNGIVRAEAGLTIGDLLSVAVPRGWFVPVTPGTKAVTLGGALANDVHGKNHHEAGTFGCHVRALSLLRTDGQVVEIGPDRNPALFGATVAGLGLTGLVLWVEMQLQPIASSQFEAETLRLSHLDDFFRVAEEGGDWPYTVAWVDCLASGAALGRGLFSRGRHAPDGPLTPHGERRRPSVPLDAPAALLGPLTVRLFNALYARQPISATPRRVAYDPFLYPLDGIADWNRLYGASGFFQHQSVVPLRVAPRALQRLLEMTSSAGQGSFLVVLKLFGRRASPGLLSFPEEGATFALDLPNRGESTRALLDRMADIVMEEGGRLYPAKDATMSASHFRAGYPRWREVEALRDPGIMSDFWRRVTRAAA